MDLLTGISAAVQAVGAIAIVFLTLRLIRVTERYVNLTREMLENTRTQLAASFRPNLRIAWLSMLTGAGFTKDVYAESVSAEVELWNQGSDPIKLSKLRLFVSSEDHDPQCGEKDLDELVLSPGADSAESERRSGGKVNAIPG